MDHANPYETPSSESEPTQSQQTADESAFELTENLLFSSRMLRFMSIFAGIASLYPLLSVWAAHRYYGLTSHSTSWLIYILARLIFVPLGLHAARVSWRYAADIAESARTGQLVTEATVELRTRLWLTICGIAVTFVLVFVLRIAFFLNAESPITSY